MPFSLSPCGAPSRRLRRPAWIAGFCAAGLLFPGSAEAARRGVPVAAEEHPRVRAELRRFQGSERGTILRGLARGSAYLPMIRSHLVESGLPEELCWLPLIESGFSNHAVSPQGAAGMWQLMPRTARAYGLRVDGLVDERRHPVKATRAAVRHLKDLMERFESPWLAAAAYNAGSARVWRGLERLDGGAEEAARTRASPGDSLPRSAIEDPFFRLADAALLARETRDYVPRWVAASLIGGDPRRYGFSARGRQVVHRDSVVVTKATWLDGIADAAGVPARAVRELNPELIRGVTPPGARTVVRLPRRIGPEARARIAALPSAEASAWRFLREPEASGSSARGEPGQRSYRHPAPRGHTRVEPGESLEDVARRCGVAASTLARVNRLPRERPLLAGLLVRLP